MANPEHLAKLKEGVEAWNEWRKANPELRPELTSTDLRGLDLTEANLTGAFLENSKLGNANLHGADLSGANLRGSNLANATITYAVIRGANLDRSDLSLACLDGSCFDGATLRFSFLDGTCLSGTSLIDADLSGSHLNGTIFRSLNLKRADFRDAGLDATVFEGVDLSEAKNIEFVDHQGRSSVAVDCLISTARGIRDDPRKRGPVEQFLRAAGLSEPFMQLFLTLIEHPIAFHSCFISYSHADKAFAKRLYEALQMRGIRCWMDEKDLDLGAHFEKRIDEAIRDQDKLIVCCSESSTRRDWVELEVNKGEKREKEDPDAYPFLIPLDLDGSITKRPDSSLAMRLSRRLAANFTGWETDNAKFEEQFERVVQALKTEKA